tara:strand:- start:360 stop:743 length:384 start_codon:yes stop_codon:yes gene_type:complete
MDKMINSAAMAIASSTMPSSVKGIIGDYGTETFEYSPDDNTKKYVSNIKVKLIESKKLCENDISKLSKEKKDKLNLIIGKINELVKELENTIKEINKHNLIIEDNLKENLDESLIDLDKLNNMYNTI